MYAPVLNQIGPALIARGYEGAADYSMQGSKALAAGISSAGSSIGNAVADAAAKWQSDAKENDAAAAVLDTFHKMNDHAMQTTGQPIVDPSLFQDMSKMKPGTVVGLGKAMAPVFDSYLSQQRQLAAINAQGQMAQQTAAVRPVKASAPMFNVGVAPGVNIYRGGQSGGSQ
jgi:hypothetical protein